MDIFITPMQLSRILNVRQNTIYYYVSHSVLPKPRKKANRSFWEMGVINSYIQNLPFRYNLDAKTIQRMTDEGITRIEMGKILGVPTHAIACMCLKHNIKSKISTSRASKEKNNLPKINDIFNALLKAPLNRNK